MGESKHTPAPWSVSEDRDPGSLGYSIDDKGGFQIAKVCELEDAQIMAAAPKLLKAVEQAKEALEWVSPPKGNEALAVEMALASISAALAAARGAEVDCG